MNQPTSVAPDATREQILSAAVRVLGSTAGFTMERVAEEAGVSRATVYRRFGSVEELLGALRHERGATRDTADTRARILDAALAAFIRSGVHGATMQEIAEGAGVSPATIYNHFDDKEALVAALIGERGPSGLPVQRFARLGSERAAIEAFTRAAVDLVVEQRDLFGLVIAPDPITRRAFRRVRADANHAGTALEELLRKAGLPEGIDPKVATACLMGMVIANGALRPLLFGEDVEDADALARQIADLFTRAVEFDRE